MVWSELELKQLKSGLQLTGLDLIDVGKNAVETLLLPEKYSIEKILLTGKEDG